MRGRHVVSSATNGPQGGEFFSAQQEPYDRSAQSSSALMELPLHFRDENSPRRQLAIQSCRGEKMGG